MRRRTLLRDGERRIDRRASASADRLRRSRRLDAEKAAMHTYLVERKLPRKSSRTREKAAMHTYVWTQDLQHETQYQPEGESSCPCRVESSLIRRIRRGCIASPAVFAERSWLVRITMAVMLSTVSVGLKAVYAC